METLVQRQIRFIPIKEGIEFDGQQGLRTKVMIASGSYIVFNSNLGATLDLPQELVGLTITVRARSGKSWSATITEVVEPSPDRLLVRTQRLKK